MSDVQSGGRIDGDGEVVGRRVEGVRRYGRTYDDGRHVDDVKGHHVKVGVGVLPSRKGRRCYSGL